MHYESMNNEIHIKFGGDHGGKSFKLTFQICNKDKPNSSDNTVVFNIFEAKDHKENLKTALSQYKDAVDELQSMTWQYVCLYLFICVFVFVYSFYYFFIFDVKPI